MSISTQLYKSYNARLNELFYDLDDTFREYKIKKDNIILDKAINIFDRIFSLTKKEYDDIQKSLYKQYPWYKYLNQKSFIVRFLMDLSTLFYEAC
ncbi:hypothetical protein CLHOM_24410 [Clostridium homopropionicum DSM 5847]|uniref:Uncharacterized protein n=1 Tax=Clostridium homopropionicum DSM 5847 TaxID=1121318 RepID=A0A0L6Z8N9_9CLOT|nr:hypothetical protein [Clostridium homopropionicum]KOA19335.1 hypothetical protein CLHOM_24410 [Clostridium homopropionicum DSM 5847]SFG21558.1 hypothetical protein SAMN04488501_106201 [Clostridium homopropionicum]